MRPSYCAIGTPRRAANSGRNWSEPSAIAQLRRGEKTREIQMPGFMVRCDCAIYSKPGKNEHSFFTMLYSWKTWIVEHYRFFFSFVIFVGKDVIEIISRCWWCSEGMILGRGELALLSNLGVGRVWRLRWAVALGQQRCLRMLVRDQTVPTGSIVYFQQSGSEI